MLCVNEPWTEAGAGSLAETEAREDPVEDRLGGRGAGDLVQGLGRGAQLLREDLERGAGLPRGEGPLECHAMAQRELAGDPRALAADRARERVPERQGPLPRDGARRHPLATGP